MGTVADRLSRLLMERIAENTKICADPRAIVDFVMVVHGRKMVCATLPLKEALERLAAGQVSDGHGRNWASATGVKVGVPKRRPKPRDRIVNHTVAVWVAQRFEVRVKAPLNASERALQALALSQLEEHGPSWKLLDDNGPVHVDSDFELRYEWDSYKVEQE